MPISLSLIWMYGKGVLLPMLFKIPKEVWIVIGIIAAFLYYGHYTAKKARLQKDMEYAQKTERERLRQESVFQEETRKANQRAAEATRKLTDLEREIEDVKTAVSKDPKSGNVCLPPNITDRLRKLKL